VKFDKFFLTKVNQVLIDVFVFTFAYFAAFFLKFEGIPDPINLKQLLILFPYIVGARLLSFVLFSIYSIAWRYISIIDVVSIGKACLPVTILLLFGRIFLPTDLPLCRLPLGVITLDFLFVLFGTLGVRMIRRLMTELSKREVFDNSRNIPLKKKTLLVGAGDAGNMTVKELIQRPDLAYEVVGFIDDDPKKISSAIQGVKVLGNTTQIPMIAKKLMIEEAIITMVNASSKEIRRIVEICKGAGLKTKIVPGLFEMLDNRVRISKIRDINIDDLLGRTVVSFKNHLSNVTQVYKDKRIMVTGAGGSIGSELCRQLASMKPKELILVDKDENSMYEIDTELKNVSRYYNLRPIIINLVDLERVEDIFNKNKPEIVFHAAAHKHVPLMEYNISEAVLNNVYGTRNTALQSHKHGVERFIFISTDKAINPTSVMGATKKIGEIIIQGIATNSATRFSCVRFGNVLGSRGSVVPLFQKQISQRGPITITHPDMKRYFMSISEAVQLIIQAGTIGRKGEIFVLDMGEPIRISDLAKDLIRLSGYAEDDLDIEYVGLRPGEKLFEEILIDEERAKATNFEKIFIAPPVENGRDDFQEKLEEIIEAARKGEDDRILQALREVGIGYTGDRQEA